MVNMPHWSWIKSFNRSKWKPLHERVLDELINGTSNYHHVYSTVNI